MFANLHLTIMPAMRAINWLEMLELWCGQKRWMPSAHARNKMLLWLVDEGSRQEQNNDGNLTLLRTQSPCNQALKRRHEKTFWVKANTWSMIGIYTAKIVSSWVVKVIWKCHSVGAWWKTNSLKLLLVGWVILGFQEDVWGCPMGWLCRLAEDSNWVNIETRYTGIPSQ